MKNFTLIFGFLLVIFAISFYWFSTPQQYIFQGETNLNGSKVAKAIEVLEQGLKKYPDNCKIKFLLSRAYLQAGDLEKANNLILNKTVIDALKNKTNFLNFLVEISEANNRIGNIEYAIFFASKYLFYQDPRETSNKIVKNYIRLANVLSDKSEVLLEKAYNISRAIKDEELTESVKAHLLPRYFNDVEHLKSSKQYENALKILSKAEIIGKNAEVSFQEALIYKELNRFDLAQEHFDEALLLDPENNTYKIAYANALKQAATGINDPNKRNEYLEKIKLLLGNTENSSDGVGLLNRIINLNAKYKVVNADLKVKKVGEYLYPSLVFKAKPVSDVSLKNYRIIFFDQNNKEIDNYESPITNNELNQIIEVTSKNPIAVNAPVNAKIFFNNEFVREFMTKE